MPKTCNGYSLTSRSGWLQRGNVLFYVRNGIKISNCIASKECVSMHACIERLTALALRILSSVSVVDIFASATVPATTCLL